MTTTVKQKLTKDQFKDMILSFKDKYYTNHPFYVALNSGKVTQKQFQGWVANRYYFHLCMPCKDAAIIANCHDVDFRRHWTKRIIGHDGVSAGEGAIENWIKLGEASGLSRNDIVNFKHLLPGVRSAVDNYVGYCQHVPWQDAVCASLTEAFAVDCYDNIINTWTKHYTWLDSNAIAFFNNRVKNAPKDIDFALNFITTNFTTQEQQERVFQVLQWKMDLLWSMLDAIYLAYVVPENNR